MGGCISPQPTKQQPRKTQSLQRQTSIVNDFQKGDFEQVNEKKTTKMFNDQKSGERIQDFLDHCQVYRIQPRKVDDKSHCSSVARQFERFSDHNEKPNIQNEPKQQHNQFHIENQKDCKSNENKVPHSQSQNILSLCSTSQESKNSQMKRYQSLHGYDYLKNIHIRLDFL